MHAMDHFPMRPHRGRSAISRWILTAVWVGWTFGTCAGQEVASETAPLSREEGLQALQWTSQAARAAADRIAPCLVTIESFGGVSAVQGKIGGIRQQGEGNTTGVMISPDGLVVTSTFNFIQQPPIITVITSDGKRRVARMLGRDDTRKLCLLQLEDVAGMPVPELFDPAALRVGQWAVSLGVGYGDTNPALSLGIISATNRVGGRAIQTDANLSPANYGGPLIDLEGRLLGICVPMNPQSQAVGAGVEWYDSGIGFAIPLYGREEWLERLRRGEQIRPAFLGIQATAPPDERGLIIAKVVPDSPADRAGLRPGDRIVGLAGKPVTDMMQLRQQLNRFEAGQEIELEIEPIPAEPNGDVEQGDGVEAQSDQGEPPRGEVTPSPSKTLRITLGEPPAPKTEGPQLEPPQIR